MGGGQDSADSEINQNFLYVKNGFSAGVILLLCIWGLSLHHGIQQKNITRINMKTSPPFQIPLFPI